MSAPPPRPLTAWQAIFVGQLVVNVPVLILFAGGYWLGDRFLPHASGNNFWPLLAAFIPSLIWGVIASRRWQRWSARRGVDPAELRRLAALTLLMMPWAGSTTYTPPPPAPKSSKRRKQK